MRPPQIGPSRSTLKGIEAVAAAHPSAAHAATKAANRPSLMTTHLELLPCLRRALPLGLEYVDLGDQAASGGVSGSTCVGAARRESAKAADCGRGSGDPRSKPRPRRSICQHNEPVRESFDCQTRQNCIRFPASASLDRVRPTLRFRDEFLVLLMDKRFESIADRSYRVAPSFELALEVDEIGGGRAEALRQEPRDDE